MDSKFGTLILIQNPFLEILKNGNLNVQVGRTYFQIKYYQNFFLTFFVMKLEMKIKEKHMKKFKTILILIK